MCVLRRREGGDGLKFDPIFKIPEFCPSATYVSGIGLGIGKEEAGHIRVTRGGVGNTESGEQGHSIVPRALLSERVDRSHGLSTRQSHVPRVKVKGRAEGTSRVENWVAIEITHG